MLYLNLREGDYVMIGDSVKVQFREIRGEDGKQFGIFTIDAPKDMKVLRNKLYEAILAERAEEGCEESGLLLEKLRHEHSMARIEAGRRRSRRQTQKDRVAAGEIKASNVV